MSVPLDNLYHYIDAVAQEVSDNNVIIYRFDPHGSKKVEDLITFKNYSWLEKRICPRIYCYDQEPLNFDFYRNIDITHTSPQETKDSYRRMFDEIPKRNFRTESQQEIYDHCLLLHSEQRSKNVEQYRTLDFIPVYYWNHALLSLDWYRYAQHVNIKRVSNPQTFLIYNRAWTGTREYRLKLADLLIKHDLVDHCRTTVAFEDNGQHYSQHSFENPVWQPQHTLENYFENNITSSCYSARFDTQDYEQTQWEVVLETLFDDDRLHLTEKTLRPIALGQPFLLAATHGSLQYLRNYGFQTFGDYIDESYDTVEDPAQRLESVVKVMKEIVKNKYQDQIQRVADRNKKWFFSREFFDLIDQELRNNLAAGIKQVFEHNTTQTFFDYWNMGKKDAYIRKRYVSADQYRSRQEVAEMLRRALHYRRQFNRRAG